MSGSRSGYEVSVPSEELDYHPHSLGSGNVEITALAVHSNAFESETVRAICLAASDTGSPGAKAESELALDLQLHLAGALPRVSVEGTADRKRSAGPSGNPLYAHLQRLSQVAGEGLFGRHFHRFSCGIAGTRSSGRQRHSWRWHDHSGQEGRRQPRLQRPQESQRR